MRPQRPRSIGSHSSLGLYATSVLHESAMFTSGFGAQVADPSRWLWARAVVVAS